MIHRLRVGHFDRIALHNKTLVVLRPIEPEALETAVQNSQATWKGNDIGVGESLIVVNNGYLDCPWKTPQLNEPVIDFLRCLLEITDCVMFEHLAKGEVSIDDLMLVK